MNIRKRIIQKLNDRPKVVDRLIKSVGDKKIVKVRVCRKPVTRVFQTALNFLTKGQWESVKRKYNYDDVFHLWLEMVLEDGSVYSIEKNQRVKLGKGKFRGGGDCKETGVNKSVREFIENGESSGNNFYRYNADTYNCQHFVKTLLNKNGVYSLDSFVGQNTQELLTKRTSKVLQAVSDVGAVGSYILSGGGRFKKSTRKGKKYMVMVDGKWVHFGSANMKHYKDSTGLGVWSHMDHNDKERRKRYLARAKGIKNKNGRLTWNDGKSANYFSVHYLW